MSLLMPPFRFAHCSDNLTASPPPLELPGNTFTAGANDTDGAAVATISALTHDCHYLVIGIGGVNLTTADSNAALDVLVDPAGGTSWTSLIDDLVCGGSPIPNTNIIPTAWYHFPLYVASGTSFGVRCKTVHTADITTGQVVMYAFGHPSRPDMWWCGSKVETLGISDSKGTSITPGATGVAGTWTNVGGTTSGRYGAIQFGMNAVDSVTTTKGGYWEIGRGSTKLAGTPTYFTAFGAATDAGSRTGINLYPTWTDIPEGTQMQVRGTLSGAAENYFVALYGTY